MKDESMLKEKDVIIKEIKDLKNEIKQIPNRTDVNEEAKKIMILIREDIIKDNENKLQNLKE